MQGVSVESSAGLAVRNLNVFYGPIQAVFDLSFLVSEGSIVALLGANGAGKTTTLRTLAGFVRAGSGEACLFGHSLGSVSPERRVRQGLSLVPDNRLLFPSLTVDENLRAGGQRLSRSRTRDEMEAVFQLFPVLAERRNQHAGSLSGGQAQMLAIGRALMTQPRVLMLDEPSQGLAPNVVSDLAERLSRLTAERGMTILLVEQNAALALHLASYGYVLANGRIELEGPTEE